MHGEGTCENVARALRPDMWLHILQRCKHAGRRLRSGDEAAWSKEVLAAASSTAAAAATSVDQHEGKRSAASVPVAAPPAGKRVRLTEAPQPAAAAASA